MCFLINRFCLSINCDLFIIVIMTSQGWWIIFLHVWMKLPGFIQLMVKSSWCEWPLQTPPNVTQYHQFVTQYHQFGQHTELFPHCQHSKTKVSSLLSQVFQQEFLSVWVIYVPLAFAVEQLQFRFWFSSSWSSRVFFYVWCSWAGTQCLFCVSGFADIGMEVAGIILNLLLVKRAVHIWKSKVMEMF